MTGHDGRVSSPAIIGRSAKPDLGTDVRSPQRRHDVARGGMSQLREERHETVIRSDGKGETNDDSTPERPP